MRKTLRGAAVALLVLLALPARADAVDSGIWTGACPIMSISISQPGRAIPRSGAVGFNASGSCTGTTPSSVLVTSGGSVTLPPVSSSSFGCVSGVAIGQGTVSFPGLPLIDAAITVVNHGGTITVTIISGIRLVAVGEFVATSVAACNNTGALTGVGSLYYFDPTLPPPLS